MQSLPPPHLHIPPPHNIASDQTSASPPAVESENNFSNIESALQKLSITSTQIQDLKRLVGVVGYHVGLIASLL